MSKIITIEELRQDPEAAVKVSDDQVNAKGHKAMTLCTPTVDDEDVCVCGRRRSDS